MSTSAGRSKRGSWVTKSLQSSYPAQREGGVEELADGVGLAGGDHVVVGDVLLEHQPHGLDVVAREAPVACGVEVAERDRVLQAELDARQRVRDLAGDELQTALLALVVEQDPRRRVEAVRLAVVDRHVVAEHLGHAVGRPRVERRELGLGRLPHLAEHLRRRRLVEADGVLLAAADDAYRLEHAQHAEAGDLRRELGLRERQVHEADGAEVVDLVGLHALDHRDERREVAQVAVDQLQRRRLLHARARTSGCSGPAPARTPGSPCRPGTRRGTGRPGR